MSTRAMRCVGYYLAAENETVVDFELAYSVWVARRSGRKSGRIYRREVRSSAICIVVCFHRVYERSQGYPIHNETKSMLIIQRQRP